MLKWNCCEIVGGYSQAGGDRVNEIDSKESLKQKCWNDTGVCFPQEALSPEQERKRRLQARARLLIAEARAAAGVGRTELILGRPVEEYNRRNDGTVFN